MRFFSFTALFLWASTAAAQTVFANGYSVFDILWSEPVAPNRIDCDITTSLGDCRPLNADACGADNAPLFDNPVQIALAYPGGGASLVGSTFFVWLKQNNDTYTTTPTSSPCTFTSKPSSGAPTSAAEPWLLLEHSVGINDPITLGQTVTFPDDFNIGLTTAQIMNAYKVCEYRGDRQSYFLCFGFDTLGQSGTSATHDGLIGQNEPSGWALIGIDTQKPPPPGEPVLKELDTRLRLEATLATADTYEDVRRWKARYRPIQNSLSTDCGTWPAASYVEELSQDLSTTSTAIEIGNLENGVAYEACLLTLDRLGNTSVPSAVAAGTPRDECDFYECFPGDLKTGYCAATLHPSAYFAALALVFVARRKRRAPRGEL